MIEALDAVHASADRRFLLLRSVLALRGRGVPCDEASLQVVAERTGRNLESVRGVAAFVAALAEPERNSRRYYTCRNTSCIVNGAGSLHDLVAEFALEHGSPLLPGEIYCLDQCEFGPSMAADRFVYRGGTDDVFEDTRLWRRLPQEDALDHGNAEGG